MALGQAHDTGSHTAPGIWAGKIVGEMNTNVQVLLLDPNKFLPAINLTQPFSTPLKQVTDLAGLSPFNIGNLQAMATPFKQGQGAKQGPMMIP